MTHNTCLAATSKICHLPALISSACPALEHTSALLSAPSDSLKIVTSILLRGSSFQSHLCPVYPSIACSH